MNRSAMGPGSAAHHFASLVLRCARDMENGLRADDTGTMT